MNKDEALKLALEALETNNKAWKHLADSGDAGFWEAEEQGFYELSVKAITAIKEALANEALDKMAENARELGLDYEPEQEPVAWVCHGTHGHHDIDFLEEDVDTLSVGTQLYTTPPQRTWVGLTNEDKSEICDMTERDERDSVMRLVEAKLKARNI